MATGRTYYWLKLRESFMTSDAVDFLMGQPDGANYVVLYQMLCLKTINTEGRLSRKIGEVLIPYDEAKIARDCKWFSTDTIRVALNLYKALGLIYQDTDGVLIMAKHDEMVGKETDYAQQKRVQRSNQKALPNHMDSTVDIVHTEIRDKRLDIRDKSIEIRERDIDVCADKPRHQPSTRFYVPAVEDIAAYCEERNNGIDAEKFFDYYERQGWRLSNNKPMKDWQAAVRTWERNERSRANAAEDSKSKGRQVAADIEKEGGTY